MINYNLQLMRGALQELEEEYQQNKNFWLDKTNDKSDREYFKWRNSHFGKVVENYPNQLNGKDNE